ncbi:MAG: DUF302 domain-containing protein [Burkholderiales bacterium]|nr:DUF302 domain-containing protein [Burkholderiales bacterium]
MSYRFKNLVAALALGAMLLPGAARAQDDGIVRVKSAYPIQETVERLKKDVAAKGIMFFSEIDQTALAAKAGIAIRPSTLLLFGNPPLGTQFVRSKPEAGIDWPVRLLVQQDEAGNVWAIYTDFRWIARRHGIQGEAAQPFETASGVIASITSSVKAN